MPTTRARHGRRLANRRGAMEIADAGVLLVEAKAGHLWDTLLQQCMSAKSTRPESVEFIRRALLAEYRAGLLDAIKDGAETVHHHRDPFDQSGESAPRDCRKDCCRCAWECASGARLAALDAKEKA